MAKLENDGRIRYLTPENIILDGFQVDIDHEGIYIILKDGEYEDYAKNNDIYLQSIIQQLKSLSEDQLVELSRFSKYAIKIEKK